MPVDFGQVGPPSTTSASDSSNLPMLQGKQGDQVISELNGKYYTDTYRGNTFFAATAVGGLAFSIYSATTFVGMVLFNPSGSGKNIVPIRTIISAPLVTAATAGSQFGYAFLAGCGAAPATGAPIAALTTSTPIRGQGNNPGVGGAGVQGSSVALVGLGATLTSALTWGGNSALTWYAGVTNANIVNVGLIEIFDGELLIPPGSAMFLTTSVLAGSSAAAKMVWAEKPI